MSGCPNCGADESQLLAVYEHEDKREGDEQPKFLGCKSCHRMMRTRYLRDQDDELPPQASLSDYDIKWLSARDMIGNQHTSALSIVEWQVVKGAAAYYGVRDWKSKADATLTAEENVSLMEQRATRNTKATMRDLSSKVQ
jgi:hypothetical protein